MKNILISNIELFSNTQKKVLEDYILRTEEYLKNEINDELITRVYSLIKYHDEVETIFKQAPPESLSFTKNEKKLISEFIRKPKGETPTSLEMLELFSKLKEENELHYLFEYSFDIDTFFPPNPFKQ